MASVVSVLDLLVASTQSNAPPAGFFIGFAILWGGIALVSVGSLVFAIFCIVDIVRRPDWQWRLAGQEKILWLLLVILINFMCLPLVMSLIYWFAIRSKLVAVEKAAQAGQYGPGFMTVGGWVPGMATAPTGGPPGWFPDPGAPANFRYWDGAHWTGHTNPNPGAAAR